MRKILLVLIGTLLLAGPALAEGIDTDDIASTWKQLSAQQRAEMASLIAQKAAETTTPSGPLVTAEKVEPWLTLIDHMGEGLVKLARDLGVTANELVVSPVGMITVGLIAYTVMGDQVMDLGIGLLWAGLTFPLLLLFFFKSVIPITEYAEVKQRFFGHEYTVHRPIRRKMVFGADEDFNVDWAFAGLLLLNGLVTVIILT